MAERGKHPRPAKMAIYTPGTRRKLLTVYVKDPNLEFIEQYAKAQGLTASLWASRIVHEEISRLREGHALGKLRT